MDIWRIDMTEEATPAAKVEPWAWLSKSAKQEARKDRLRGPNLVGEAVAAVFLSFMLWFFVAHKLEETGFYTEAFGSLEMFMLYSAGAFAIFVVAVRLILRRRNMVRPLDVVSLLLLSSAHAVLLASFPFDFQYVSDVLPSALQWTVGWMDDTIGKIILALGLIGGLIGAVFTTAIYFGVKTELALTEELEQAKPED